MLLLLDLVLDIVVVIIWILSNFDIVVVVAISMLSNLFVRGNGVVKVRICDCERVDQSPISTVSIVTPMVNLSTTT